MIPYNLSSDINVNNIYIVPLMRNIIKGSIIMEVYHNGGLS